jgi:DNA invertase Pin-like site-specific DNA recombinase
MANVAFSYLRFSTPEQSSGDSHRRQVAMADKYAADHHLTLDRSLSFRDLGVSAYRGKNAKEGSLRAFLDAIEHNLVPPNSFLLVESLDRLSRDRILAAQGLFLQIVQAGVTIVTLVDQRSYSLESLNQNPLDLIISLVSMMRANEESELKSRRIRAAFGVKREQLTVTPWSARCPGWLRLDKQLNKFVIIEERAEIVRGIYRDALAGVGHPTIVRRLNEDRVPLFGHGNQRGKIWQITLIRHWLRTPTVIGTHIPYHSEYVDGVRHVHPQTPIENYYPAIIEKADWDRVQEKRAAWSAYHRNNVPKTGRANLLAGLARCSFCDRRMVMLGPNTRWRYFMCRLGYHGVGCSDQWVRYSGIEDALTVDIEEVIRSCPKPTLTTEVRSHRLKQIRIRLHTLRHRLATIDAERTQLRRGSRPVRAASDSVETEIRQWLEERKRMRIDRPRWLDLTLSSRLEKVRYIAKAVVLDRVQLHAMFQSLFTKVVIDWKREMLIFHWKHGGESSVRASMKPLREVQNVRRSDRPRFEPGEMGPRLPPAER